AEAAGVQAAYTTCASLYPAQLALFDAQLAISLAAIPGQPGNSQSIADGRTWGQQVAQTILSWRSTDGLRNVFSYLGVEQPDCWRTPTAGLSGVNVNLATMEPFTMKSCAQFRLPPPYGSVDRLTAIATSAYAADVNEVTGFPSLTRTYTSFTAAAQESAKARIWIGFHFRTSCEEGLDAGYEIANHAVEHFLRRLRHGECWPSRPRGHRR
ncbi:MAG TPA: hypothetical protein VGA56_06635, partial [Opitutaceae bacterium]